MATLGKSAMPSAGALPDTIGFGVGRRMALRSRLFLVSYAPLFAMLALQNWPAEVGWNWSTGFAASMVLACIVGVLDAVNLIRGAHRTSTFDLIVKDIQDEGSNAAGYLTTYLVPFIAVDFTQWTTTVSYAIFFLVLFVIFVRSNFGLTNPTLYLLGWRTFQATTTLGSFGQDRRITVVCRKIPGEGRIQVVRTTGGYILKESR